MISFHLVRENFFYITKDYCILLGPRDTVIKLLRHWGHREKIGKPLRTPWMEESLGTSGIVDSEYLTYIGRYPPCNCMKTLNAFFSNRWHNYFKKYRIDILALFYTCKVNISLCAEPQWSWYLQYFFHDSQKLQNWRWKCNFALSKAVIKYIMILYYLFQF